MTLDPRTLKVGDEIHCPRYPHMHYFVNAVDDLHIEIRDQLWTGVIYTHDEFREHMGGARKVQSGEQHKAGWFE